MNLGSIFLLACLVLGTNAANSVSNYFRTADRQRLKAVFTEALSLKDLQQIHYSALGYKLLNEKVVNGQAVCKVITDAGNSASLTTELAFYVATSFKALGCSGVLPVGVTTTLNVPVATEPNSVSEVYYAVLGLIAANQNLPEATKTIIAKNLQMLLKKDDSLLNLGQTFYIASELGTASSFAADRIEDAIVQADEVDGKMLQFEGGLGITSLLLSGSLKLTAALKRAPVITAEQGVKFASYLLSRRSVQTPKGAWALLESLTALADSKISPASISLGGPSQVSTDSPLVSVRVCDLLGRPLALPTDSVIAQSVTRKGQESVVVLSKQKLTPDPKDQTLYTLDLLKVKPEKGLYKLALSAGSYTGNLVVKVLGRVAVKSAEIGVGDADQAAPAKKQSVTYPNKISTTLEADSLQRLLLKVLLVDEASNKPIAVHQCFVKLANKENKQEIIFVAELDNTQTYKFEMDIGAKSAAFGHRSGLYSVELLVGDAVLANALKWHIADANLHFSQELANTNEGGSVSRGVKPEIVHKFREPDVRPSRVFSDLFSGLCAAPLLILLVLWAKLKANVSNFSLSLSAVVFHLSFGGILTLFVVFWLQLNMFETIRYLLPLSIVTFISGHRLLRSIASQRVGKSS